MLLTGEAAWRIRRLSDTDAEQYFIITESIMGTLPDKVLSCNCESAQTGSQYHVAGMHWECVGGRVALKHGRTHRLQGMLQIFGVVTGKRPCPR